MQNSEFAPSRPLAASIREAEDVEAKLAVIDDVISSRIRMRRRSLGITQVELARTIGVSPQQVHKYETGCTAISASRLYMIMQALDLTSTELYDN